KLWSAKARRELARVSGRSRASGLTETERRVAELVAAGRSNNAIASALFVTGRTAETHLTHAYPTLGVTSRTALAGRSTPLSARSVLKASFNRKLNRTIVVDARGISLYAFYFDESGKPTCYVEPGYRCVKSWPSCVDDAEYHFSTLWPPLLTAGRPRAGKGVDA